MLFNSLEFLFFLPLVVLGYYLFPNKLRWVWLLAASYSFYMWWEIHYITLILVSTLVDYAAARGIYASKGIKRKTWLALSLICNLSLLGVFKYYNFFIEEIQSLFHPANDHTQVGFGALDIMLPVGISFYTFQTMSYTIDVYKGMQKPEKHLGIFALYVAYFPQLVAGPIERFASLGKQLRRAYSFSLKNLQQGGRLVLYGLFTKMCIADNFSPIVDEVFQHYAQYSRIEVLWGMLLYSFQIFADFHGYSLIAVGAARLMGVELMHNFRNPYAAQSITDFWRRWHISLTTWFREYLFIPLGGSRTNTAKWIRNILLVFLVSGLWHGANWTFIIWGGIHGIWYLFEKLAVKRWPGLSVHQLPRLLQWLAWVKTFVFVCVAWVFFRSPSAQHAVDMFQYLGKSSDQQQNLLVETSWMLVAMLVLFMLLEGASAKKQLHHWLDSKPFWFRWSLYGILIFALTASSGVIEEPFIYFQF